MRSTLCCGTSVILVVGLTLAAAVCHPITISAQDQIAIENAEVVTPSRSWEMKVLWEDYRGTRHRTRGWLMLVSDDALILSVDSPSGRPRQKRIHASKIIRVKYRERGTNPLPSVATGAFEGALSGGYVPLQTGNIGLDLLTGALQGAIGGLFQGNSFSRRIYVDQRTDFFKYYVYPELVAGR